MMFGWIFGTKNHIKVDVASVSERGLVRRDNQDHFFIADNGELYCVADGMGGGEGGAIASDIVCRHMERAVAASHSFPELMKRSSEHITLANSEILDYAAERHWRQMGTTLAALFLDEHGTTGVVCHVGDSRVYRIRAGEIELLTHDHTLAGEIGRRSSNKRLSEEMSRRMGSLSHVLTRAVGIEPHVTPDWRKIDIHRGDTYMICSDGVHDMVDGNFILGALCAHQKAQEAADALSKKIVEEGACDNFTFIILKIEGAQ